MARSGQASVDVVADFAKFASEFQKGLNAALRGITIDMSAISGQISSGVKEGVDSANAELRKLGDQAGDSFNIITQKSSAAGQSMAASFARAGREMASIGDKLTMGVTLPVVAAGTITTTTAGNFEAAMNKVKAATESAGAEFAALRDLAIRLGSTTAFSASEAAFAMNELATAGFDVGEIMGALPGVLDMAAAGSVSLSSAASIASGILNGFGFAATDLGRINDILARTFLSTATTLTDLGESFKYVGPTAKSAGVSFTEISAAIGLLGNAGIKGSMAGTALNASISRLLKPTGEVEAKLRELGITVSNSAGKLLPLVSIMRQLEAAGADTADMITLFGLEAGPDMMALLSQGSSALAELDMQLQNAGGTAQRVAKTQMAGFNGAMDELSSAAEGLMIAIGDAGLLGWLTSLAKMLTTLTAKLAELDPTILKIATVLGIVAAAIGPMLAVFGRVTQAVGEGVIALKKFGTWATKAAPSLAALAGPIGWATVAVLALVAAVVVAYNKSETFRAVVDDTFQSIGKSALWMWRKAVKPAFEWIYKETKRLGTLFAKFWKQAQPVFVAWGSAIVGLWTNAIKPSLLSIGDMFAQAGKALRSFWTDSAGPAIGAVLAWFSRLAVAVRAWWSGNGDAVMRTAAQVVTWLGGVMAKVWSGIMAVLRGVAAVITWVVVNVSIPLWKALIEIVRTVIAIVIKLKPIWIILGAVIFAAVVVVIAIVKVLWAVVSTAFKAIGVILQWLWSSIVVPVFSGIGTAIKLVGAVVSWLWSSIIKPVVMLIATALAAVGSVIIWLWGAFQTAFRAIASVVTWFWSTFGPIWQAIAGLVWAVWSGVFSVVFDLLRLAFSVVVAAAQVFWGVLQMVFSAIGKLIMGVWNSMIWPVLSAIGAAFAWLWGVIQPAVSAIGAAFAWLWNSAISPALSAFMTGLNAVWNAVVSAFSYIVAFISGAIDRIVSIAGGITAFVNSISSGFQSVVDSIRDKINSAISFVRGLPGQILAAIGNLGALLFEAGQNVINGLIDGIASRLAALKAKIAEAAQAIRNALPFSPAREGPLSGRGDPTLSGSKIVSMIASGMEGQIPAIRKAVWDVADVAASMPAQLGGIPGTGGYNLYQSKTSPMGDLVSGVMATAAAPRGAGNTYNLVVNALDARSAARATVEAIQEWERYNGAAWRK